MVLKIVNHVGEISSHARKSRITEQKGEATIAVDSEAAGAPLRRSNPQ